MKRELKCAVVVVMLLFVATAVHATRLSTATGSALERLELQEIWYKVKSGDNLNMIARNFGTSVEDIRFYNEHARGQYIFPGQKFRIILPVKDHQPAVRVHKKLQKKAIRTIKAKTAFQKLTAKKVVKKKVIDTKADDKEETSKKAIITIKAKKAYQMLAAKKAVKKKVIATKGDDNEEASKKAIITIKAKKAYQMLAAKKAVKKKVIATKGDDSEEASKKKIVKISKKTKTKSSSDAKFHVVREGEVLGEIAEKTGLSVKELRMWNGLDKNSTIRVGQKLRLTKPRFYVAKRGDSLYRISKKTGVPVAMLKYFNKGMSKTIQNDDVIFLDKDVFIPYALKKAESSIGKRKVRLLAQYIDIAYKRYGVDRNLIAAVIKVESNFNSKARSRTDAYGLMQLMDETAHDMRVNRYDELQNVMGGTKYLAHLFKRFNGDLSKVLAGYNAGPGTVEKYKGIPPYRETKNFIAKVKKTYNTSVAKMLES